MRNLLSTSLAAAFALLLAATPGSAQEFVGDLYEKVGLPRFSLNAVTLISPEPGRTKVHAYVEVSYARLQFIRSTRGYEANYEVDLSVLAGKDEKAPRYANRIWRSTILASSFEEASSSRKFDISEAEFELPPGTYTLVATLRDLETRREARRTRTLTVPSYGMKELELGDLILAREVRLSGDRSTWQIVPNAEHTVTDAREPVVIFFETAAPGRDSLQVYARVLNEAGRVVQEQRRTIATQGAITRNVVELDATALAVGRYVAELEVSTSSGSALKGLHFRVRMAGVPGTVQDLDSAIRQLRYIAPSSTLNRMMKADPEHKEILFRDWWERQDPTPGTETNELMQEYYARVQRANQRFGGFRPGWETDRGEVFIRFGKPDEIERHPFEIDSKPYEIWYYYDIQRRFVFVDELGYGEYRLASNLWR